MKKLEGKVAVVTGSARGIGAAIAERLAMDGADVAINYSRSADAAKDVADRVRHIGARAVVIKADVGDLAQAKELVDQTVRELGRVDILVNNVASVTFGPLEGIDHAVMRSQLAINVEGPVAAIQAASPHLPNQSGRVINISSSLPAFGVPGATVYAASKGALDAMTRTWAAELGPRGITVNAVAAGPVVTDLFRANATEEMKQHFISRTPLGRIGMPADIADVVAFLASTDARWVTGHVLAVTGGFVP